MGTVNVTISVGDPQGHQFEELEVTVDTGSTFTAVPRELLERLTVPVLRSVHSELTDGSSVPVDIGRTVIRLEGQEFPTPVIFAEEGEPSLLGMVSLEEALLAVDPVAGRLVPTQVLRLRLNPTNQRRCVALSNSKISVVAKTRQPLRSRLNP